MKEPSAFSKVDSKAKESASLPFKDNPMAPASKLKLILNKRLAIAQARESKKTVEGPSPI